MTEEIWNEFHRPTEAISDFLKQHRHNVRAALDGIRAAKTYGSMDAPEMLPAGSTIKWDVLGATEPCSRRIFRR